MDRFDLDDMSIEELAKLRDDVTTKLAEKVGQRQQELQEELECKIARNSDPLRVDFASNSDPS